MAKRDNYTRADNFYRSRRENNTYTAYRDRRKADLQAVFGQSQNKLITPDYSDRVKAYYKKRTFQALYLVFGILLFYVVSLALTNRPLDSISFRWFLELLRNAPIIPTGWVTTYDWSSADWGVFNWFRDFVVVLQKFFTPLEYFVAYVAQLFTYIIYFLGNFFTLLRG